MKTKKLSMLLAILILLTTATAKEAKKAAKPEISNTNTASCLVKVTAEPAVLPLNFEIIEYLLRSSGVAGKAAREVLDVPLDIANELFSIEPLSSDVVGAPPKPRRRPYGRRRTGRGSEESEPPAVAPPASFGPRMRGRDFRRRVSGPEEAETPVATFAPPTVAIPTAPSQISPAGRTLLFLLQVELDEDIKPAAEEFLAALTQNLRETLLKAFSDHREKLLNQLKLAEEEARRAEDKLEGLQNNLRSISGSYDLSRQAILSDIRQLRKEEAEISMHMPLSSETGAVISNRVAKTENKVRRRLERDPVTDELQAIVEMYAKQLTAIEKQGGSRDEAMRNLARARIELAERREKIRKSAGGDLINSLNKELAELSLEKTQGNVRLKHIRSQLHEAERLLGRADEFERNSLKAELAKRNLEEAFLLRDRLRRKIHLLQEPAVTVLGGD